MKHSRVLKEVRQAIIEMYEKGMSTRKIAKAITQAGFSISHMTVSRIVKPIRIKQAFERKKHKQIPLTVNIETETLEKIRERMKRLKRHNESEMINEAIQAWLTMNFEGSTKLDKFDRSQQILVVIENRLKEFQNRRQRYKDAQRKTFLLNEGVLESLRLIQNEISEYLEWKFSDYAVIVSNPKIPLEAVYRIWMSAINMETIDTKPIIVPLSEIINAILTMEYEALNR